MFEKNNPMVFLGVCPYTPLKPMLTAEQINEIHRLHWAELWPVRKIARHLHIGRRTIAKHLAAPAQTAASRPRSSKLDPFKPSIAEFLEQNPRWGTPLRSRTLVPMFSDGGPKPSRE